MTRDASHFRVLKNDVTARFAHITDVLDPYAALSLVEGDSFGGTFFLRPAFAEPAVSFMFDRWTRFQLETRQRVFHPSYVLPPYFVTGVSLTFTQREGEREGSKGTSHSGGDRHRPFLPSANR